MTRLLLCALIAIFTLAACGNNAADEAPATPEPAQQVAPPASVPASEAESLRPPPELQQPAGESDGERHAAALTPLVIAVRSFPLAPLLSLSL